MKRLVVILLVLGILGAGAFYFWQSPVGSGGVPAAPRIAEELARRAALDIPLAVAHLENHQAAEAIALLTTLQPDMPQEKAILQNLVIGRYLAFTNAKETDNKEELRNAAMDAVQKLQAARPDDWHSYALGGLLLEKFDDGAGAYSQFEAIAPIATITNGGDSRPATRIGDVTMLYAMAKTGLALPKGPERQDALAALVLAADKEPENFWVLRDLILALLEEKDLRLAGTLGLLAKIAPVVESSIQRANPNFSLAEQVKKSLALLEEAKAKPDDAAIWQKINGAARQLCNTFYSEDAAQSDRKYLERHPLDFAVSELPASVIATLEHDHSGNGSTAATSPLKLEWGATALPEPLQGLSGVRQVRVMDMTLDRKPELCVLTETQFSVWSPGADGQWSLLADLPVAGVTGFVLTDLDDDSQDIPVENDPSGVQQVGRADLDVVLYGEGGVQLVQNTLADGKRTLTPWPAENSQVLSGKTTHAEAADLDLDGDMDLILAGDFGLRLGFNTGKPVFFLRPDTPVQVPAGLVVSQVLPCDIDRDQDIDVVVVSQGEVNLLENLRHATLRWKELETLSTARDVSQVRVLDVDGNASWDLLLTGKSGASLALSQTPESGKWLIAAPQPISSQKNEIARCEVADLDNDGAEDLLGYGGSEAPVRLTRHGAVSTDYEVSPWDSSIGLKSVTHLHASDYDKDGDLDLCLVDESRVRLWENKTGNQNAWLNVEVVGKQVKSAQAVSSGRVNHFGVGSLLEIRGTTGYQARIVTEEPPHFGLGPQGTADLARLIWPNGFPANVFQPKPNQTLWEVQTLLGSCPYLYAWDGEKYQFATDLLWAAPLGMPSPAGGLTPSREWEFLKIPGELCREQGGYYTLQLTEELYEAAYFDQVQLIAVDHPVEVAIYSNEKVGPPTIAEKKIHTVRHPRKPVSAKDQQGRDILPAISDLDEVYTRLWDHKINQGWTEKTTMELDLGSVPESAHTTLFLTGWVYPTDPSISVSIQQDQEAAGFGIQPPSLEIPDGSGGWKVASPYIGFPGGKTKTIAIDLTGQLVPGDGRVRIVTSMELSWDQVFFTVDEAPAEVREIPLELVSANLHFRGCSSRIVHPQFGPERYDYSQIDPMIYSSMGGKFTRYGDVAELLTSRDDRMLILGCGDECTLRFKAAPAPSEGWTRDFLIHNVGWDKDCNPQNILCKTVEPLPHARMRTYPPVEPFPEDELTREYLKTYQTRQQSDVPFRRFLFVNDRNVSAKNRPDP